MSSPERSVVWDEVDTDSPKSLVEFIQMFSDKTATTVMSPTLVAYPIHIVFTNCSYEYSQLIKKHGDTVIGLVPSKVSTDLIQVCSIVNDQSSLYWHKDTDDFMVNRHSSYSHRLLRGGRIFRYYTML